MTYRILTWQKQKNKQKVVALATFDDLPVNEYRHMCTRACILATRFWTFSDSIQWADANKRKRYLHNAKKKYMYSHTSVALDESQWGTFCRSGFLLGKTPTKRFPKLRESPKDSHWPGGIFRGKSLTKRQAKMREFPKGSHCPSQFSWAKVSHRNLQNIESPKVSHWPEGIPLGKSLTKRHAKVREFPKLSRCPSGFSWAKVSHRNPKKCKDSPRFYTA